MVDVAQQIGVFGHLTLTLLSSRAAFGQVIGTWKATILNSGIGAGGSDDLKTRGPRETLYIYCPKDLSAMLFTLLAMSHLRDTPCKVSQCLFSVLALCMLTPHPRDKWGSALDLLSLVLSPHLITGVC